MPLGGAALLAWPCADVDGQGGQGPASTRPRCNSERKTGVEAHHAPNACTVGGALSLPSGGEPTHQQQQQQQQATPHGQGPAPASDWPRARAWLGALLHRACADDDITAAARLLAAGADPDARDGDGRTPLHAAAADAGFGLDSARFVRLLLAHGASAGARDAAGRTPLMLAAAEVGFGAHAVEAVAALLAAGADARETDPAGRTPLHYAGCFSADPCLYISGATDDLVDDITRLRCIVRQLLAAGADPAACDAAGRTPAAAAAADGNACALLALLAEGVAPPAGPLPAALAAHMAAVFVAAQQQGAEAAAEAERLRCEASALRAQVGALEAEQLANLGPGLRALIVGAAAEARRLERARECCEAPAFGPRSPRPRRRSC